MGSLTRRVAKRSISLASPDQWLLELLGGKNTTSGTFVNEKTALECVAVYACVKLLSSVLASLPFNVYQQLKNGQQISQNHDVYPVLHDMANDEMTAYTWKQTKQSHVLLWGNSYSYIDRDPYFNLRGLWPLRPDRTWPERDPTTKQIIYKTISQSGQAVTFDKEQILHIPGLGFDGLKGYSVIGLARETIGFTLAVEEFGSRFFGNGAQLNGVLQHPKNLSESAQKRLKAQFEEKFSGLNKSHQTMILEEGLTYERIGIPPEDSQFLTTRQFNKSEIATLFGIQPHLIGELSRATNNNIEHQGIEFVVYTLMPWLVNWEQSCNWKLFGPSERQKYFTRFDVSALLRGDIQSRYNAYATGRNNGFLSQNDIRSMEDMNPLPEGQGDDYLIPLNTIPGDMARQYWQAAINSKGGVNNNGNGSQKGNPSAQNGND